jgi:hypothetical protein
MSHFSGHFEGASTFLIPKLSRAQRAKYPSLAKNPPSTVYHSLYSSTEELQVALRTYMFFKLGLKKENSLHILHLQSLHP